VPGIEAAPDREAAKITTKALLRALATKAPGRAVEVRVPPVAAIQCIEGPRHTRGTPPNVVETDPRSWLLLATGLLAADDATAAGTLRLSGSRAAEIGERLPLVKLGADSP
jgi:hypothetical protein